MKYMFFLLILTSFSSNILAQQNPTLNCSLYGVRRVHIHLNTWDVLKYSGILDDSPTLILVDPIGNEFKNVKWSDLTQEEKMSYKGWTYYKANFKDGRPDLIVGGWITADGERRLRSEGSSVGVMFGYPVELSLQCTVQPKP